MLVFAVPRYIPHVQLSFETLRTVVIVCSTTGNGDPPNNADRFWRWLRRRTHDSDLFRGMRFAVLALGDTNYDKWCHAGRNIAKRMLELSAEQFYITGCTDEQVGLESVVEPWIEGLWRPLQSAMQGRTCKLAGAELHPNGPVGFKDGDARALQGHVDTADGADTAPSSPAPARCDSPVQCATGTSLMAQLASRKVRTGARTHATQQAGDDVVDTSVCEAPAVVTRDGAADDWGQLTLSAPSAGLAPFGQMYPDVVVPEVSVLKLLAKPAPVLLEATILAPPAAAGAPPPVEHPSFDRRGVYSSHPSGTHDPAASNSCTTGTSRSNLASTTAVGAEAFLDLPVTQARYLTAGGAAARRRVLEVALQPRSSTGAVLQWTPGDTIGVSVCNAPPLVAALAAALALPLEATLHVDIDMTAAKVAAAAKGKKRVLRKKVPGTEGHLESKSDERGGAAAPTPPANPQDATSGKLAAALASVTSDATTQACRLNALAGGASPPTVRDVLSWGADLTTPPRKAVLSRLAQMASDVHEAKTLQLLGSATGKEYYAGFVAGQGLTMVDLLHLFPSVQVSLGQLLSMLPPLPARFYSLSSSPFAGQGRACFAATTVTYARHGSMPGSLVRHGVATHYLEEVCAPWLLSDAPEFTVGSGPTLRVQHRSSKDFHPPASHSTPMIMVGPGTGVAPFLGFLQHRAARWARAQAAKTAVCSGSWRGGVQLADVADPDAEEPKAPGATHLLFGNRHPDVDWLYRQEMSKLVEDEVLTHYHCAWSRQSTGGAELQRTYVQDKMAEPTTAVNIAKLILQQGACVYVCGDGARMVVDVHAALVTLLATWGKLGSSEAAEAYLKRMSQAGRYAKDVWSA